MAKNPEILRIDARYLKPGSTEEFVGTVSYSSFETVSKDIKKLNGEIRFDQKTAFDSPLVERETVLFRMEERLNMVDAIIANDPKYGQALELPAPIFVHDMSGKFSGIFPGNSTSWTLH